MLATSLRSRLGRTLAPLKPKAYHIRERIKIHSQVLETICVEPLSSPIQLYAGPEVINIPVVVGPDWLPILLDRAMPAQYGRMHELPLLEAQSVDLSSILVSDIDYEEIDFPNWLVSPQAFVAFFDDLFEPLGWTDVDGKHYGSRQARAEEKPTKPGRGRPRARPKPRKSYELADEGPPRTKGKRPRYKSRPSFWDIIFPVLQPPLDLGSAEPIFLPYPLYPFQYPGVEFLREHPSALLGDEMGTGKTVMTSLAMRLLFRRAQIRHALVVCPVSVLRVWDHHLMDWAPELSVTVVHGQSKMRRIDWATPAHVYLTTYDTLRSDIQNDNLPRRMWRKFDLVVADEIQYVKNVTSKRSRALRRLKPELRWGLSGTPMENKSEDIVSIFRFLKPGLFDNDNDSPAVIRERMAPYFLRRRKKDVLPDLPPKVRQEIWLDLDSAQRRVYMAVEEQIRGDFIVRSKRGAKISRIHIFAAIQKLKQICNFAPDKTKSPKTYALGDIVEEIAATGSKIIVFSQYVEEGIGKLEKLLEPYGVAKVVGGQSRAMRDAEVDQFRSDPETHVLLATIKSGGVGLTLTEASYIVHFDHWWNPALKWQAEDRVHRVGQQAAGVNIYEFWMSDTIDERIHDILERKQLLFEEIVDSLSAEVIERGISDEEWLSVLGIVDTGAKHTRARKRTGETDDQMSLEEILGELQEMDPFAFEHFVGELFQHLGYPYTKVTGKSSDGGIDVVAWRNTQRGPERVAVQCKRYKGNVGVKIARELAGVVASDPTISKGILVTTGGLTPAFRRFCARTPELEAIASLQLARYIRNFGIL